MSIDLSDAYHKLVEDHRNYSINNSLRYNFVHNGYNCIIFHVNTENLFNILTVIVEVNSTLYPFALQMIDPAHVSESITKEVYPHIKIIIKPDKWKTAPFFNQIKTTIMDNHPVYDRINIESEGYYHYKSNDYKPYFWCFSRVTLSATMKKKLYKIYPSEFSRTLISFCISNRITTCFTSDISKAKDIKLVMKSYIV